MGKFFGPSHISAGFIAVLVGYTSSAAIVFQAATAAGAGPAHVSSWLLALGVGMALTCIGLSLYFRSPVLTAWSTPGAALLATALVGLPMSDAIGTFIFASALLTICGVTGWVETLMKHVPKSLAAAMLAGVLLRFGMGVFVSLGSQLRLVALMLFIYLAGRRLNSRYTIPLTFLGGLVWAAQGGLIHFEAVKLTLAQPVFIAPTFTISTIIGVGIPLFIVTMASQNVPGIAVLRANGYQTPVSPLIGWTGLTGVLLAPIGGFQFNLAAITAAICMSPEADVNPERRYLAAVWAGIFYLITGLLGATVATAFAALPKELVAAIAGIALLGTIGNSLAGALHDERERDAALITFLVTASGLTLRGIGSAFWGLLLGLAVLKIIPSIKK
ncbi:benzoate/H(+) symporter BenE family transporter [Geobacter sp. SVR]|uniref:benzoate/H(+) symporter BenE family transporter n=1 Tax=Geobacter sp. SVR TaxID=2495594 RepID=UPI00143EFDD5|nr:benzoate/H(+) symporter BenE family transporter [Geobacter sp. SVR]BCS52936.1 benzoate transporter [Geobacter sp. SVR]GCF84320.1 membrane protein [Geobacter sp. SVR]